MTAIIESTSAQLNHFHLNPEKKSSLITMVVSPILNSDSRSIVLTFSNPKITRPSSDFEVPHIHLESFLFQQSMTVVSKMDIHRKTAEASLVLKGKNLTLVDVCIDGQKIPANEYNATPSELTLKNLPEKAHFSVTVTTQITCNPLEFRRSFKELTYMVSGCKTSSLTVGITADEEIFNAPSSNGTLVESVHLCDGMRRMLYKLSNA